MAYTLYTTLYENATQSVVLDFTAYRYRLVNYSTTTVRVYVGGNYQNNIQTGAEILLESSGQSFALVQGSNQMRVELGSLRVERESRNTAPTQPGTFTSPVGALKVGETVTISWGASTDAEGDSIAYELAVSINSGAWDVIRSAIGNSHSYVIPTATTLKFRLQAYNLGSNVSQERSPYRESSTYTVNRNAAPTLTLSTTDARTLYENDVLTVAGSTTESDVGNVVNVKYQLNGGTIRAIVTQISSGAAIPFSKALTFKGGKLYDGATEVTGTLVEGTNHTLKVWAEDDQGGKSAEQSRTFQIVANRPAVLTVNPFTATSGQIDSDSITVSGTVVDPENNTVTIKYKIGSGSFVDVYSGQNGPFSFAVRLSALAVGANTITIQAADSYGAVSTKTLRVSKAAANVPLKTSEIRYKIAPPNGSAKGAVIWIQRESGDIVVSAEISMTASGAAESYVAMTKTVTAYVTDDIEEDEFTYEVAEAKQDIYVKLKMVRAATATEQGIKLISGVLS